MLVTLVAAFAIAEIGMRVWLGAQGVVYDSVAAAERVRTQVSSYDRDGPSAAAQNSGSASENDFDIHHPYFGFDRAAYERQLPALLAYFRTAESEANYDVFLVGGSVAVGLSSEGSMIADVLGADPRLAGRTIVVYGVARAGFKQPQSLFSLEYLLALGAAPDAVIAVDGFNEVAISMDNFYGGCYPSYPNAGSWFVLSGGLTRDPEALDHIAAMRELESSSRAAGSLLLDSGFVRSALAGYLGGRYLARLRSEWTDHYDGLISRTTLMEADSLPRGPAVRFTPEDAEHDAVRVWSQCTRSLDAICRARGIDFVSILQPCLIDAGSKTVSAAEQELVGLRPAWVEGVQLGYPLLREAARALSARHVACADLTGLFRDVSDTLYIDACHLDPEGNRRLARGVAESFLRLLPAAALGSR